MKNIEEYEYTNWLSEIFLSTLRRLKTTLREAQELGLRGARTPRCFHVALKVALRHM